MKNKRIVDAWNKIEPCAAEARMLDSILARKRAGRAHEKKGLRRNQRAGNGARP